MTDDSYEMSRCIFDEELKNLMLSAAVVIGTLRAKTLYWRKQYFVDCGLAMGRGKALQIIIDKQLFVYFRSNSQVT